MVVSDDVGTASCSLSVVVELGDSAVCEEMERARIREIGVVPCRVNRENRGKSEAGCDGLVDGHGSHAEAETCDATHNRPSSAS